MMGERRVVVAGEEDSELRKPALCKSHSHGVGAERASPRNRRTRAFDKLN